MHQLASSLAARPFRQRTVSPVDGSTVAPVGKRTGLPLEIRPVITSHQKRASNMLVTRMYGWRGYQTASVATGQFDDPNRLTLAAWHGGEIAATLTVCRDSGSGLLAETLYGEEVADLRRLGRRLCEVSRFAVDPQFSSQNLLGKLFHSAYQYGRSLLGGTDAVIEVNPRHAGYYQRQFGFSRIGDLRICPRVEAPAVLMHRAFVDTAS